MWRDKWRGGKGKWRKGDGEVEGSGDKVELHYLPRIYRLMYTLFRCVWRKKWREVEGSGWEVDGKWMFVGIY